jgi:hypothetical protein
MKLFLTGEDGYTLYTILNKELLTLIKTDLCLSSVENIWFRPSFGRGSGPKKKEDEKGYSGFGEPDALIIGKDDKDNLRIVFLESKLGELSKSRNRKELRYQFFLKLAMIHCMLNPIKKAMGESKVIKDYYCLELNNDNCMITKALTDYYNLYKGKESNKNGLNETSRKNGWSILKNSPSSPALRYIEKQLENKDRNVFFSFYAVGYVIDSKKDDSGILEGLFENGTNFPPEIKRLFSIDDKLKVKYRLINIPKEIVSLDLPV